MKITFARLREDTHVPYGTGTVKSVINTLEVSSKVESMTIEGEKLLIRFKGKKGVFGVPLTEVKNFYGYEAEDVQKPPFSVENKTA